MDDFEIFGLSVPALVVFVGFELGLGVLAVVLQLFFPADPAPFLGTQASNIVYGLPLIFFAFFFTSGYGMKIRGLRSIYETIRTSFLGDFVRHGTFWQFIAISAAAGIGEEILFRGWLQPKVGWWLSSLIFGLLHALTFSYFVIATAIGLYLGWVWEASSQTLLAPILIHFVYDLIALVLYRKKIREENG